MKDRSRLRLSVMVGAFLLSVYLLIPTVFNFSQIREGYLKAGQPLPTYLSFFPKQGLNFGLDLRGGIYLELEVETKEALGKRLGFIESELKRVLADKPFLPETIGVKPADSRALYQLDVSVKAGQAEAFREWFASEGYHRMWQYSSENGGVLSYSLQEAYKVELTEQILRQAMESIGNRVDRYGVAEAGMRRYGADRIIVELPGIGDPQRVIDIIRQTGQLDFKIVDTTVQSTDLKMWIADFRKANTLGEGFDKATVDRLNEGLKGRFPENTELAFELIREPNTDKIIGGEPYLLQKKTEMTGDLLEDAQVVVQDNRPVVSLSMNTAGTRLFSELTKANVNRLLAIVLDGNVIQAPRIKTHIPNGQAIIEQGDGLYDDVTHRAKDLSLILREGALPASLSIAKKNVIGPSLGADSIQKGFWSTIVGAVLVVVFMAAYYKTSGLVANISLILNIAMMLGVLSFFQASLTLPGIAGIALTVGMAVDANVVIFERIKDELWLKLPVRAAFERGYANAVRAVLDANVTTFISGLVLYQFGTGPIKGFATTLMIGIVTTLISAVVFSRWIQELLLDRNRWSRIRV